MIRPKPADRFSDSTANPSWPKHGRNDDMLSVTAHATLFSKWHLRTANGSCPYMSWSPSQDVFCQIQFYRRGLDPSPQFPSSNFSSLSYIAATEHIHISSNHLKFPISASKNAHPYRAPSRPPPTHHLHQLQPSTSPPACSLFIIHPKRPLPSRGGRAGTEFYS